VSDRHFALPEPSAEALEHSQQLTTLLREIIQKSGGAIPFSQFMERALYAPGLGYYSAGAHKFGPAGDFITAPESGALFATTLAKALSPVIQEIGPQARWLELGGGSGVFAEAVLRYLYQTGTLPASYAILEPSADLRQRQKQYLQQCLPTALFSLLHWLDRPFDDDWQGVIVANEVIDALPCPRFLIQDGQVYEQTVGLDHHAQFISGIQAADSLVTSAVRHIERYLERRFINGYSSEVLAHLPYWFQGITSGLQRGAVLFVDYGYPRHEYYQQDRDEGTIRAFYRHHVHNDLYRWPGLQDITASVDFTALAEAGTAAGFELAGYCSQASFLLGNGLIEVFENAQHGRDETAKLQLRNEFKRLTLPTEMGERFQVMGFSLGLDEIDVSSAFALGDLRWRL